MRNKKKTYNIFSAWDHKKELDFLNKQSEEGWQMYWSGGFYAKYEKDEDIIYKYQLDFNPKVENPLEYFEYFKDQGWEYISSTFNGWHYFRKLYDSNKPDHEYEIYTDLPSKKEMTGRLTKFLLPIAFFEGLVLIMNLLYLIFKPELRSLTASILFGTFVIFFARGIHLMSKSFEVSKSRKKTRLGLWLGVIIILITTQTIVLDSKNHLNLQSDYYMGLENKLDIKIVSFESKLPDIYYFTSEVDSKLPTIISIENNKGDIIYSTEDYKVEKKKIFLKKGMYNIKIKSEKEKTSKEDLIKVKLRLN